LHEIVERSQQSGLELWGGVECTINRVRDEYFEQLKRSGHIDRFSDFDRFAGLGIKALRHPVLWESIPSYASESERWAWADASLRRLHELNIRPIVGLVHHGSGPRSTDLLDPSFPAKLAVYAEEVATRFPYIQDYTPVNEPLTTARFSALYGHWYPHRRDDNSFCRALLNECRAVVLAMQAIRRVNPAARLIQTDDLGNIHSTPQLAYQAEFENQRRWSSFDLLCGRVDPTHRLWRYFLRAGIESAELEWFLDHPCPPDVIGLNYYLSGERYLDEHLDRYPPHTHGGNGKDRYADVLASRVLKGWSPALEALLCEAWQRYKRPIAITECHNGCTREEQLRWFVEVWGAAQNARQKGAEIVAVTAWSLLGAFDWNHLVTQKNDHYEPGIYDIRSSPPRPTALAGLIKQLATGTETSGPLQQVPGWWRRPCRFLYGVSIDEGGEAQVTPCEYINQAYSKVQPILITGADGRLAQALARLCELRGIPYRALSRHALDIANVVSVRKAFLELHPWAVINAAGYSQVDSAELDSGRCFRENTVGAELLARECGQREIPFLTFSSHLVFDGQKAAPYVESDSAFPLNGYGRSKAEAERRVEEAMPGALIIRSSAFFSPWDQYNFVVRALRTLSAGQLFRPPSDVVVSPTYLPDLVNASLDLLIDGEQGLWHIANAGQTSWAGLAEKAAYLAKISPHTLQPRMAEDLHFRAKRPLYSALTSEKAILMPALDDALDRFFRDCEINWKFSEDTSEPVAA
jgi:dTDP-4-dehydrorhamnose reductase